MKQQHRQALAIWLQAFKELEAQQQARLKGNEPSARQQRGYVDFKEVIKVEPRFILKQAIKGAGFVTNRRQEQLVTSAVIAAQQTPDSFVKLADRPDSPAQVTSMQDPSRTYEVTHASVPAPI
ncbi:hypothetical protein ABBQ32_010643 [Trebouxia sp. C0010 RCD-2024]